MGRLVLDTNVLLKSIPFKSIYHDVWISCLDGRNYICITNEILEEYEEIIQRKSSKEIASIIIERLINNPYTLFVDPYFKFNLIQADPDDNKFVDCAVCAEAKFIVTEDKHFQILKEIDFPKVDIITLDEIIRLI